VTSATILPRNTGAEDSMLVAMIGSISLNANARHASDDSGMCCARICL